MYILDDLKTEAQSLGFSIIGVARSDPHPDYRIFEGWLAAGRHANMVYLDTDSSKERRSNPRKILRDCKTILVLGMTYPKQEYIERNDLSPNPQIAAYAMGLDYHEIIPPRLTLLSQWIERKITRPVKSISYTDTGPVLERSYASTSGLGWIGKNGLLISPIYGSYILLAEILINIDLEPDQPFTADRCGKCHRCMDACPTQCILEDRTIDSNRCISYLTIENKGSIPIGLRSSMGKWTFGCDICQIVCPWNRHNSHNNGLNQFTEPFRNQNSLSKEIHLDQDQFSERFRHTPVWRAKRRGYLRNVAVAIGNSQDTHIVPDLIEVLDKETEPLVRAHIVWALGQLNTSRARLAVEKSMHNDLDNIVRLEARQVLDHTV